MKAHRRYSVNASLLFLFYTRHGDTDMRCSPWSLRGKEAGRGCVSPLREGRGQQGRLLGNPTTGLSVKDKCRQPRTLGE